MGIKIERKPFRIGSSFAVTLPLGWCQYYGDRISTVTVFGHDVLILAPKGLEEQAQRMIEIIENSRGCREYGECNGERESDGECESGG